MANVAIGLFVECCETHDVCGVFTKRKSVNRHSFPFTDVETMNVF